MCFFALYADHARRIERAARAPVFQEYSRSLEYWERSTPEFSDVELAMHSVSDIEAKQFCMELSGGNTADMLRLYNDVPALELYETYVLQVIRRLRERQQQKRAERAHKMRR